MPVQDLYYKKYLKYKNKYLELKQYGGGSLEEAKARINDRVREDEENNKLINTCKEFFIWPTSKVASQRKEDDEYVAKNDKIENNKMRLKEMEMEDAKTSSGTDLLFSYYVKKIFDTYSYDPDKPKTVKSKIIYSGKINFAKFDNYLKAVQYVRDNYDRKDSDWDSFSDNTKWLIIDNDTNAVLNRDEFYYTRNKGKPDPDDFYKVNIQPEQYYDGSDSDGYKSD
jgi:hypothetical protein